MAPNPPNFPMRKDCFCCSKRLLKEAEGHDRPGNESALKSLAKRIERAVSPASSVYMRKQRIRIGGHLWSMVADDPDAVSTFTLIPRTWEFAGGSLDQADPRLLLEQLRQTLIRCGAQNADGWLFAAIHGEHEPNENIFRLHVHGLAKGGMREVVSGLRERKHYQSSRKGQGTEKVHQRVRMSRQPLDNLPEPLTYITQSFWPERAIFRASTGSLQRQKRKRRIEEPYHSEVLHWLDHWSLNESVLLMGLQVVKSGLRAR